MIVKEANGFSREKALEVSGLDVQLDKLKNATQMWKKAGSPINSKDLNKFAAEYIKKNKTVGAYVVVEGSADDTRLRPYAVINEATNGKRKTSTTYQIKEAELTVKYHNEMKTVVNKETGVESEVEVSVPYHKEVVEVTSIDKETGDTVVKTKVIEVPDVKVISVGSVEARATKKDTALKIMKELIEQNKKDYVIEIVKEVTDGQKYAGYGKYTPSKSAKLGKFIFFVQE